MALSTSLNIRQKQTQKLNMTPQLLQSIKILQLNQQDLSLFIHEQIEQNPFLDLGDDAISETTATLPDNSDMDPSVHQVEKADITGIEAYKPDQNDIAGQLDVDYESLFPEQTAEGDGYINKEIYSPQSANSAQNYEDFQSFETYSEAEITLVEHLKNQLGFFELNFVEQQICIQLIDSLSPSGYLNIEESTFIQQIGANKADFDKALNALQSMEPTGIGARNLKECLSLQLKERNHLDPWMEAVLDHLDLVAAQDIETLHKKLNIKQSELRDILKEIRSLDPKPGLIFDHSPVEIAAPDVRVLQASGGGYKVELLSEALPKVLINESYYTLVKPSLKQEEDKVFLNEKLQEANWLIRNLDQRARTILKVATEILRQQEMFFSHGISHLKPLKLSDIAENVEMHESTISRVTSNKYIETPRGIFEMRYFFSTAVGGGDGGEEKSAQMVKFAIKQLIDQESADKILSDDAIAALLKDQDIQIARRTVAKYREAQNIPSSSERRKAKRML